MAAQPEATAVDAEGISQHYPGGVHLQIDPELISQLQEAMNNPVPPDAVPDDQPGDEPDDNPVDDGGDNPDNPDNPDDNPEDNPGDNPEDNPGDNPDNPGDDGDNPGIDDGGQNDDTPDDTTTVPDDGYEQPTTSKGSSGKLPNTGTQLALLAGAALLIGGVAYVARRAAGKRVR